MKHRGAEVDGVVYLWVVEEKEVLIKQNHIILQRETKHFVVCHIEQKRVLNSKKMQKKVLVD